MDTFDHTLIGTSAELGTVIRAARIVAATDVSVLIIGESGTGKQLLARAIHAESPRANGAFVNAGVAALLKGSLQTANGSKNLVDAARGGTLFVGDVNELSLDAQAHLLALLLENENTASAAVPARVIAATDHDLFSEVKEGRFRQDLYYRLRVVPLELPPLRMRKGDIARLLEHFTADLAGKHARPSPRYRRDTLDVLKHYPWPGNVRELRNFCEQMVLLTNGQELAPEDLPPFFVQPHTAESPWCVLPEGGLQLEEWEAQLIRQALARAHGNRSQAARLLGLTRDTLLYRIKKYAIDDRRPSGTDLD